MRHGFAVRPSYGFPRACECNPAQGLPAASGRPFGGPPSVLHGSSNLYPLNTACVAADGPARAQTHHGLSRAPKAYLRLAGSSTSPISAPSWCFLGRQGSCVPEFGPGAGGFRGLLAVWGFQEPSQTIAGLTSTPAAASVGAAGAATINAKPSFTTSSANPPGDEGNCFLRSTAGAATRQ